MVLSGITGSQGQEAEATTTTTTTVAADGAVTTTTTPAPAENAEETPVAGAASYMLVSIYHIKAQQTQKSPSHC